MQYEVTFDLDEAAGQMARETGRAWSMRDVLRAAVDDGLQIFGRVDRDAEVISRDSSGRFSAWGTIYAGSLCLLQRRNLVALLNGPDTYLTEVPGDDGNMCQIEDELSQPVVTAGACRVRPSGLGALAERIKHAREHLENGSGPVVQSRTRGDWGQNAQDRARSIIERQRLRDLFPSQNDIANEIAREFRVSGVVGSNGKPLTGAYIKRHALRGISSEVRALQPLKTGIHR